MDLSYEKDMRTDRIKAISMRSSDFVEEKLLGSLKSAMERGRTVISFETEEMTEKYKVEEAGHEITPEEYGEDVDPDDEELWY